MKKKLLSTAALVYFMAQNASAAPSLTGVAGEFLNTTIKPLFPFVVAIVFIVMILFNIGDLMGDNKNYKAFFTKVGVFIAGIAVTVAVFQYLSTMTL